MPKIKDEIHIINLDEYKAIETHLIVLYVNGGNITYFDSFEVKYIPKESQKVIGNENNRTNIYRIHAYDSVMCVYFCSGFIDFMIKGKSL